MRMRWDRRHFEYFRLPSVTDSRDRVSSYCRRLRSTTVYLQIWKLLTSVFISRAASNTNGDPFTLALDWFMTRYANDHEGHTMLRVMHETS